MNYVVVPSTTLLFDLEEYLLLKPVSWNFKLLKFSHCESPYEALENSTEYLQDLPSLLIYKWNFKKITIQLSIYSASYRYNIISDEDFTYLIYLETLTQVIYLCGSVRDTI